VAAGAADTPYSMHKKLALESAVPSSKQVPRYSQFELTLNLSADYVNPFDPSQIDVGADFQSPSGRHFHVNGFLYQQWSRQLDGSNEKLTEAGQPVWMIRFSPDEKGKWRYRVHAKDHTGEVNLPEDEFTAIASSNPGGAVVSKNHPAYFAYQNGKPYYPIGEDMCWGGNRGTYNFDDWLSALSKAGGNWIRLWMWRWSCGIEWSSDDKATFRADDFHGLGVYNLASAWKLDKIMQTARENGVDVMLCLGTYGEFQTGGYFNEGMWNTNPYNAANGGPCANPADFWTNAEARKMYQQRLRYLAARYGSYSNLFGWEFWNEANPPASWVQEMAQCIKGVGPYKADGALDPYHRMVSTTYGSDAIWKLPEVDFSMNHNYGTGNIPDFAPVIHDDALSNAKYNKPHFMAEFGIDWRSGDEKYDPEGKGINLHNAIWSAVLSGDAASAMIWYWDSYIAPRNLYYQYTALRKFTDTIPWNDGKWKVTNVDNAFSKGGAEYYNDMTLTAASGWGKESVSNFDITPYGVKDNRLLPAYLYSPGKQDLRDTPSFHVDYHHPGKFLIHINQVSTLAKIRFLLDGKSVRELTLDSDPSHFAGKQPDYKSTAQNQQYKNWVGTYDKYYGIDVPAGSHTITLDCYEGDWVYLDGYELTGYRSSRIPDVNIYAISNGKQAAVWVQNAQHDWMNVADKKEVKPVQSLTFDLHGLADGNYRIQMWDTIKGVIMKSVSAVSHGGVMHVNAGSIESDIALRAVPGGK
jgi:hypothetical protein